MDWRPPEPECVVNGDGLEHMFFSFGAPFLYEDIRCQGENTG